MKNLHIFCSLAIAFAGIPAAQAQIMPDSTVQICAYWTPGDKYTYRAEEEKFKVDEKGDTTLVHRQSELRTFEIVSQTKDRYRIRLTYGAYKTTDEEEQRMTDAITAAVGPCIVEFETDETGTQLGITNLDALVAQGKASAKPALDAMWKGMDAKERKGVPKKKLEQFLIRKFSDPSVMVNAVNDDLGRMFFFHGARLDTTQVYEFEETFAPLLGGDSLRGKTQFWVDSKLTDKYSAVCNTYTEADSKETVISALMQNLQELSGKKELPQELRDSLAAGMSGLRVAFKQYSSEEIHLDTGWPLHLYFEKTVTATGDGSEKQAQTVIRRTLDIITEEEKK